MRSYLLAKDPALANKLEIIILVDTIAGRSGQYIRLSVGEKSSETVVVFDFPSIDNLPSADSYAGMFHAIVDTIVQPALKKYL